MEHEKSAKYTLEGAPGAIAEISAKSPPLGERSIHARALLAGRCTTGAEPGAAFARVMAKKITRHGSLRER